MALWEGVLTTEGRAGLNSRNRIQRYAQEDVLYGIDKAARYIEYYTTIIVEGIFNYFAFYRLLQDTAKPIVVSTLGTRLTDETISLLQQLNIKNIIVAYDWDNAGKAGIKKISKDLDCTIYYLGGMKPDEDPADKLKDLQNIISGFSLKHLSNTARKIQKQTDKPVGISFLSSKPSKGNHSLPPYLFSKN